MRSHGLTNLLVGLVALAVLATAGLALYYVRCVQKLNGLQLQAALVNRNRALGNALANEVLEYSKRNPAIDPVLQSVGIKRSAGSTGAQAAPRP